MSSLLNQVVVITGATGNLGAAVAEKIKATGAKRALCGRSAAKLESLYGKNFVQNDQLILANVDLVDFQQVESAVEHITDHFGRLDALVHAVGLFKFTSIHKEKLPDWDVVFNINFRTALLTSRAVIPIMIRQKKGTIVTVASQQAFHGKGTQSAYSAAKGALLRFTESMAAELKDFHIRANAVVPAIIDTPENRQAMPDADFSEWTSPQSIADTIVFLLSDASRAITGAAIPVTGNE